MYFITCPMQLQCLTQLRKWLKVSFTTSNHLIIHVNNFNKLHLLIGQKCS